MNFRELFAGRLEEGPISNAEFSQLLAHAKADFIAEYGKPRKPRRRRGRAAPSLAAERTPVSDFNLVEEMS